MNFLVISSSMIKVSTNFKENIERGGIRAPPFMVGDPMNFKENIERTECTKFLASHPDVLRNFKENIERYLLSVTCWEPCSPEEFQREY